MTHPTFDTWLQDNLDVLKEEWEEGGEPFDFAAFKTWAELKYDEEKAQRQLRSQR